MARKRRVLAQRRREHDQDVRRGRHGDDFDPRAAADEALREGGGRSGRRWAGRQPVTRGPCEDCR